MKSFCIKTNNTKISDYLLKNLNTINLNNIYFSKKKFKTFSNIIIHYKGNDLDDFYNHLINILSNCVILFFENSFIERIINSNYFYFNNSEKKIIKKSCISLLNDSAENFIYRKEALWISFLKYISEEKSFILEGFINFRLSNYIKYLDNAVDICVNKYIIDKEYSEFINLLKLYINSKEPQNDIIHLIYGPSITLLDNNTNVINLNTIDFNVNFLSDISFSSNDLILNSLLTLLPKKLYIHLLNEEDKFINTLKEIFNDKIYICKECSLCRVYKIINNL